MQTSEKIRVRNGILGIKLRRLGRDLMEIEKAVPRMPDDFFEVPPGVVMRRSGGGGGRSSAPAISQFFSTCDSFFLYVRLVKTSMVLLIRVISENYRTGWVH